MWPTTSGSDIDPHADAQRLADLLHDLFVEAIEREIDVAGGGERLPAPCRLAGFCAEDGHQAVTQILVDLAVVAADGLAHRGEQAVENEYDVVGQARLADGGESPRIEEQHGESALHALLIRRCLHLAGNPRGRRHQPRDRQGVQGTDLAGEAHVGGRVDRP